MCLFIIIIYLFILFKLQALGAVHEKLIEDNSDS